MKVAILRLRRFYSSIKIRGIICFLMPNSSIQINPTVSQSICNPLPIALTRNRLSDRITLLLQDVMNRMISTACSDVLFLDHTENIKFRHQSSVINSEARVYLMKDAMLSLRRFYSSIKIRGTSFAEIFLVPYSSIKLAQLFFNQSAILQLLSSHVIILGSYYTPYSDVILTSVSYSCFCCSKFRSSNVKPECTRAYILLSQYLLANFDIYANAEIPILIL